MKQSKTVKKSKGKSTNVTIPMNLAEIIDETVEENPIWQSRADFVRSAIREYISKVKPAKTTA